MTHAVQLRFILLGLSALVWRIAAAVSPSIPITIIGIFLVVGIAVFYVRHFPGARQTLRWAWLIPVGAGLNFAAMLGNGGMMPYIHVMSSAWWVWLGDWIGGVASIGDILLFVGFSGVALTLAAAHDRGEVLLYDN